MTTPEPLPEPAILASGRYLTLMRRGHWEFASRAGKIAGAVAIVAVTPADELILVEQFRVPLGRPVIELPAGLVGDDPQFDGETLLIAAQRELLEETGYEAENWEMLTTGPTSAGLSDEQVTLFLATKLSRQHLGGGVDQEQIIVHQVPLAGLANWLAQRAAEGVPCDAKIYAGCYFYQNRQL